MAGPRVPTPAELSVSDVLAGRPSTTRMVLRALRRRCPRCGSGHLFTRWVRMKERCPGCGYLFERGDDGFFLGAYFVNLLVTEIAIYGVFIWLIVRENNDPGAPVGLLAGIALTIAVLLPVLFYPVSRTLWAALHLANDPLELREIVDAVDAVEAVPDGDARAASGPRGAPR